MTGSIRRDRCAEVFRSEHTAISISFVAPQDEGLPPAYQHQPYSEATSELIDAEVRGSSRALLKAESLNAPEIREVTGLCGTSADLQEHSAR